MAVIIDLNETLLKMIVEAEKLTEPEQREALAFINALNYEKKKRKPIAKTKGLKPVSMEEIDRIKHESRKKTK